LRSSSYLQIRGAPQSGEEIKTNTDL